MPKAELVLVVPGTGGAMHIYSHRTLGLLAFGVAQREGSGDVINIEVLHGLRPNEPEHAAPTKGRSRRARAAK